MARWLGLIADPTAGGTTLEDLAEDEVLAPTLWTPVTTAQITAGINEVDRNAEVTARRANRAPRSFAASPSLTFGGLAYPAIARLLMRKALSGSISSTGTGPAAISSTVSPAQSGDLQALIGWLLREEQLDRITGAVIGELSFDFPIDGEGSYEVTAPGLFRDVSETGDTTDPNGDPAQTVVAPDYTAYEDADTFMLRDAAAFVGGSLVELTDLAGFRFSFNNNLVDDMRARFRPRKNIGTFQRDGDTHKLWFPNRHRLGAQAVTGGIDFSSVNPDRDLVRTISHAEKLVFEVSAGPLGTTPAADAMMRLTIHKSVFAGDGAEPLKREGDQTSSYEFSGYIDESAGKDLEATFVGATALT